MRFVSLRIPLAPPSHRAVANPTPSQAHASGRCAKNGSRSHAPAPASSEIESFSPRDQAADCAEAEAEAEVHHHLANAPSRRIANRDRHLLVLVRLAFGLRSSQVFQSPPSPIPTA